MNWICYFIAGTGFYFGEVRERSIPSALTFPSKHLRVVQAQSENIYLLYSRLINAIPILLSCCLLQACESQAAHDRRVSAVPQL
jgi:hypothetical protein